MSCASKPDFNELPAAEKLAAIDDIGYRCELKIVTGSNMKKRRCTTKAQRLEEEKYADDMLKKASKTRDFPPPPRSD